MKKITIFISLLILFSCEDDGESNNDEKQISSLTFEQSTPISPRRMGASAVSYENEVYVIGGVYKAGPWIDLTTIDKFDNKSNQWVELTDQVVGRHYHTTEVINGIIYIIGGRGINDSNVETVQAYNISTNTLSTMAPLSISRRQMNSVVYEGKIYVVGGDTHAAGHTGAVEVYDPSSDSWSNLSPMPTARECDIALVGDKIYAFGGYDGSSGLRTVEIYDISSDSWTKAPDMPYDLSAYHLASIDNYVFLFGDYDGYIDQVHLYNTKDNSFIKLSTNFTGRRHAAVVKNGEWIYVIGGSDGTTFFDTVEKTKPF